MPSETELFTTAKQFFTTAWRSSRAISPINRTPGVLEQHGAERELTAGNLTGRGWEKGRRRFWRNPLDPQGSITAKGFNTENHTGVRIYSTSIPDKRERKPVNTPAVILKPSDQGDTCFSDTGRQRYSSCHFSLNDLENKPFLIMQPFFKFFFKDTQKENHRCVINREK